MSAVERVPENWWAIAGIFLLAGWVKGVVGMGLPLDAMGSLALIMLTAQAATLLIVPSLVTNVWQFTRGATAVRISCRLAIGNFLNALHHSDCSSPAQVQGMAVPTK
jgi:hypothetical protein